MDKERSVLLHGTCVAFAGGGVLLRGRSGSGKSDLALRLLHLQVPLSLQPVQLVADDQVHIRREGENLVASAPAAIAGKLEVRGVGIVTLHPVAALATLRLIVDLCSLGDVERHPHSFSTETVLGISIDRCMLYPFEASAALKVALALEKCRDAIGEYGKNV